MTVENKRNFIINFVFILIVFGLLYFFLKFATAFLLPFVIGLVISIIAQHPVDVISNKLHLNRNAVSVTFVAVAYILVVALIVCLGYVIYEPLKTIIEKLPVYISPITEFIGSLNSRLAEFLHRDAFDISEYVSLSDVFSNLSKWLTAFVTGTVSKTPQFLISTLVTIVASCYIAKDYTKILAFAKRTLPKSWVKTAKEIKSILFNNIFKIIRGYIIVMFITFCELALALWIFRIPNFIPLAAIIAVVDVLPVLGVGTVLIPWSVVNLLMGNTLGAIEMILLYVVIAIVRNFIEPRIIGKQMGLHPLITLVCMFVGLRVFGILGMFALPISVMILNTLHKSGKFDLVKYFCSFFA